MIDLKPIPQDLSNLNGWYQMSNETYHRKAPGLSPSGARAFKKSPAHFLCRDEQPETEALFIGSAFHCAVLEPERYTNAYEVLPDSKRFTQALKDDCSARDVIPIKQSTYDNIQRMTESVMKHPDAKPLLKGEGIAEASGFWKDKKTGIDLKTRPDFICFQYKAIVDLKKSGTTIPTRIPSSPEEFQKKVAQYDYHWSAWWQLEGLYQTTGESWHDFVWIVVEDKPPYSVGVYRATDSLLYMAYEEVRLLLQDYSECLHSNVWSVPQYRLQDIDLPDWRIRQFDQQQY